MSWTSLLTKALGVLVVLPLMVTRFSTADVALWYLFVTALSLQIYADFGFSSTLIRMFSYARSGLKIDELSIIKQDKTQEGIKEYNWHTIEVVWQVMNFIYKRLGISLILFILLSSYFLYEPIQRSDSPIRSLIAWGFIVVTSFIQLRYATFANYLQGMNQIALVKKWETLFNLFAISSNCLILYFGGDLLILVISNQLWSMINILRDYFLSRSIANGKFKQLNTQAKKNEIVFNSIWPSVWRSGIGIVMSAGLLHVINLIISKNGTSTEIASYLLGYNLMRQISIFSQAPFYSRIPTLAELKAKGDIITFARTIKKGMAISYWSFIIPVVIVGIVGVYGLKYIKSNVDFPAPLLWASLGFGVLLERCGAMHIQIYSTTNKIIMHIANGVTGILVIILCLVLNPLIGVYAVPAAIIGGNLLFYTWFSMYHSYKEFRFNFLTLESKGLIPCFVLMLIYLICTIFK